MCRVFHHHEASTVNSLENTPSHTKYSCRAFHQYECSGSNLNGILWKNISHADNHVRALHQYDSSDGSLN
uniref:Uncharacterized protein n=1 Tax=Anguilla anguilla TaxID=7936 RepID=A0A0E9WV13_ANGAN